MDENQNPPPDPVLTCGVMKDKDTMCNEDAVDYVSMTDEGSVQVKAILCLCPRHSQAYDDGKALLIKGSDGQIWQIQVKPKDDDFV